MITKVTFRPYASSVNNRQTQPQKVNFGNNVDPRKVGMALAYQLSNLTNSGFRGTIVQDVIETLTLLKNHCGLSEEIYTAAITTASTFRPKSLFGRFFGG